MEPEYDYSKEWAEIAETENKHWKEIQHKKDAYKESLRPILNVDKVYDYLNEMSWEPEGLVHVRIIKKEPTGRHIAIDVEEKNRQFTRQDEDVEESGVDHVYCWQTGGYTGDDYSGWLLIPLSDGRYFRVNYSC
jgi:hypothetical protein